MKFGRIQVGTPEGTQTRIVAAQPELDRVVDLGRAYALTLERRGATTDAAVRLARALFPSSMAAALGAGPFFREAAEEALTVGRRRVDAHRAGHLGGGGRPAGDP